MPGPMSFKIGALAGLISYNRLLVRVLLQGSMSFGCHVDRC